MINEKRKEKNFLDKKYFFSCSEKISKKYFFEKYQNLHKIEKFWEKPNLDLTQKILLFSDFENSDFFFDFFENFENFKFPISKKYYEKNKLS